MDDLIQKWVWMETMNHALDIVQHKYRCYVYPDYDSHRDIPYDEFLRNIYACALENWENPEYQGSFSGHGKMSIGYDFTADHTGIQGKYKDIIVEFKWPQVLKFIRKMLEPDMQDRQMTLLEFLAKEAAK